MTVSWQTKVLEDCSGSHLKKILAGIKEQSSSAMAAMGKGCRPCKDRALI